MRHMLKAATILASLGFSTTQAFAGCAQASACAPQMHVYPAAPAVYDQVGVYTTQPMGYLDRVNFHRSPSVNVMRVHGMEPTVAMTDYPTQFTEGCHPTSTKYCRKSMKSSKTVAKAPQHGPVPHHAPRGVVTSQTMYTSGTTHTYGSTGFVPGEAYLPTSRVNRSHAAAQAELDKRGLGEKAPYPGMLTGHTYQYGYAQPAHTAQVQTHTVGTRPAGVAADGTYWEKVAGPRKIGGMNTTQTICKRQATVVQNQVNVVRPVVEVATPVPTPVVCETGMDRRAPARVSRYGY